MMKRASDRGVDLKYVREYYLSSRLSPDNISFVKRSLADAERHGLNSDLKPISYYFDMVFWSSRFKDSLFTKVLRRADAAIVLSILGVSILAIAALSAWSGLQEDGLRRISVMVVAANGFSQIVLQVVILLAFQVIYGYVYYKLGFIITAFMGGLALGGYFAVRAMPIMTNTRYPLLAAQALLCLYPVALLPVFRLLSVSNSVNVSWAGANVIFIILPLVSGFIGGSIFPVAAKGFIGSRENAGIGGSGGLLYGIDLTGSCVGALLAGVFIVPILGIPGACFIVAAINGATLIGPAICRDKNIPGGMR